MAEALGNRLAVRQPREQLCSANNKAWALGKKGHPQCEGMHLHVV